MNTAALVLASGLSRRFGTKDKLLADVKGQALMAYCLDTAQGAGFDGHYVICPDPDPRADLARKHGFTVIPNPAPDAGQGASIALGAQYLLEGGFEAACVLLGDMPMISAEYIRKLCAEPGDVVFSQVDDRDQPPAVFRGDALKALTNLSGDRGARSLDLAHLNGAHLTLPAHMSVDFDTPEDFTHPAAHLESDEE